LVSCILHQVYQTFKQRIPQAMASILVNDTTFVLPNCTIVTASAGSGKTYTLTLRYAQLLLSQRIPFNKLKNILAITFTNNAAAEMKQRILEYLKCAYLGIDTPAVRELKSLVSLDDTTFRARAGACVDDILNHYSDFQVQTIDSFIIRLMKVSAVEFGFSPQFEVSFNMVPIFDEALGLVTQHYSRNEQTQQMIDGVLELLDENQTSTTKFLWNPFTKLLKGLTDLSGKIGSHRGQPIEEEWSQRKTDAAHRLIDTIKAIDRITKQGKFTMTANYLKIVDAAHSGDVDSLVKKSLTQSALKKLSGAAYDRAVAQIATLQEETETYVEQYLEAKARTFYLPYVRAYRLLSETMETIHRQRGELNLAEANKILANRIKEEIVPEIYFTLGERIHHYLIDEFQDTSPIQWSALRPLIENALSEQGSLFLVGDTKQSIYSFRGADWQIMARMIQRNEFPSVHSNIGMLPINWRSSEMVVRFVNHVFQEIIPQTEAGEAAKLSGLTTFEQEVNSKAIGTGYVEVTKYEVEENDLPEEEANGEREKKKVLSIIRDCRERGYSYSDIAILTPKNKHVIEVSRWLNNAGIKFLSHSSLDIRTRTITGEILALMKFLDSPIDDVSFATFILGDVFAHVVKKEKFIEEIRAFVLNARIEYKNNVPLYTLFRRNYTELWSGYFENLFNLVGYLPVYDLIAQIYTAFELFKYSSEEEATLVKLLEVIKDFEDKGNNSLKDFLLYSEESEDDTEWQIEKSNNADVVTLMTVHKAKGLGFPVVIALFYDGLPRPDTLSIVDNGESINVIKTTKEWGEKCAAINEVYKENAIRRKVDELNKLYVALTRAREELYVISVKAKRGKEPSLFLPEDGCVLGEKTTKKQAERRQEKESPQLHVPTRGLAKASNIALVGREEVNRGELIHAVLSGIEYVDSSLPEKIRTVLENYAKRSREDVDVEMITSLVEKFLQRDDVQQHFTSAEGRIVLNEQEVVGGDGVLRRMDRIVIDPNAVTIVDFKTGKENKEHDKQVKDYMEVLQPLYPKKKFGGVLLYIDRGTSRRIA